MTRLVDKIGVNETSGFIYWSASDDEFRGNIDYDLEMIAKMPVNWVRLPITHATVLKKGIQIGEYDFSRLDYLVDRLSKLGIKVIMSVWFGNEIATDLSGKISYEDALSLYKDIFTETVKHYRGQKITYEAIDEATGGGQYYWWGKDSATVIDDIVMMHRYFYSQLLLFDPDANFIAGSYPWIGEPGYLNNALSTINKGMLTGHKEVSFHPYVKGAPEQILTDPNWLTFVDALEDEAQQLSVTEFGYPSPANFNGTYTEQEQADYSMRMLFILDMLGMEKIVYFTMNNNDYSWALQSFYGYDEGRLKPVGQLFQNMLLDLNGYEFKERVSTDKNDYVLRYCRTGQTDKLVAWTTVGPHELYEYMLSSTPQIINLNTSSDWTIAAEKIELERLSDLKLVADNLNQNMKMILESVQLINKFLLINGLNPVPIPTMTDLRGYKLINREFAIELVNNFNSIDNTISKLSQRFNGEDWLKYEGKASLTNLNMINALSNINNTWIIFETNLNRLFEVAGIMKEEQHE
ncbi:cellulase family glycosylhydrolase [Latilactobacillus sakei]|uniref:cellulase family glycosylhydrolase n=1 Tax=Latilactobacillus sakei TaxID=1599 RepID=UPI0020C7EAAC|nr:cellulase family glycosylhydrolase [Latilactobacillus sakei]MCP8851748.1 cellulase family glycosylhydrolase [Latilactobacillus sakei]